MRSLARWLSFSFVLIGVACGTPTPGSPDAGDGTVDDAGVLVPDDAGAPDAGAMDAGTIDAGPDDAGAPDSGLPDGGTPDAGELDAGVPDAGPADAGSIDAGEPDSGELDAGAPDAGMTDAGVDAGPPPCVPATCLGQRYVCGNCIDDDGDGLTDSDDPECTGACDNNEQTFETSIPGQAGPACVLDCYFDANSGAGNDECYWNLKCDQLGSGLDARCTYNPNTNTSGTSLTCSQLNAMQSAQCASVCGPVVPNGCDCFGCCAIPGFATPVFLGTAGCQLDGGCAPCTQVPSCLNTCERCELCVGKTSLPADCLDGGAAPQVCPADAGACGLAGQAACPAGESCVTGCCRPTPN